MDANGHRTTKTFVEAGKPLDVTGSAIRGMRRDGDALLIPPAGEWGNALFGESSLHQADFRVHARLTLDRLEGTGVSFLLGGHYHYPCSRPEGNGTFRISLDDDMAVYDGAQLDAAPHIVCGSTLRRAPWTDAEATDAGPAADHIRPGVPFEIDWTQQGDMGIFRIDGREVLRESLANRVAGMADGGWPVHVGWFADHGEIRLHDFWAEGVFSASTLEQADLWTAGCEGYWTYRIPGLCVTPNGWLLAFAEARRFDFHRWCWTATPKPDEVHCVTKRSPDGGDTWSEQTVLVGKRHCYEARDPSPVVDWETGDVFLLLRGPHIMKTERDGDSWGPLRPLDIAWDGLSVVSPGPCQGIQLRTAPHRGRLVVPVYGRRKDEFVCGAIYSDDHGERWHSGGLIAPGTPEPQLVELSDGRLLLNARSPRRKPGRFTAVSSDGGETFGNHAVCEALPSSGCQATLIRHRLPRETADAVPAFLFLGPGEGRRHLTVMRSDDDCATWPKSRVLYSGHSAYSALAALPDGRIAMLYERDGYRRLSFACLSADGSADQNSQDRAT